MVVEFKFPPIFDNIKAHVKKHKVVYSFGAGIGIAGITYIIMRGRHADLLSSSDKTAMTVFVRPLSFFSKQNVVTVMERESRGHPGYIVLCKETGDVFLSQNEAAKYAGTSAVNMSQHLRGKFPSVYGLHYERLTV